VHNTISNQIGCSAKSGFGSVMWCGRTLIEQLAIALWRFLEQGLVPQGAMLANR
jgi:hypothetical protein